MPEAAVRHPGPLKVEVAESCKVLQVDHVVIGKRAVAEVQTAEFPEVRQMSETRLIESALPKVE